jgi:chaperonin GroEL
MEKVGNDGVITVEESRGFEMELSYKEGMQFEKGYLSPYFITNPERMEASLDNPYILVTDSKVSNIQELLPVLEQLMKLTKNIVIIADDIDGDALTTLVVNKLRGTISPIAIKAPGFGDRRKEMLEDIAVITGATLISNETGRKLETTSLEDLGRADKVVSTKDETIIVGGQGNKKEVRERVSLIKKVFETSDSSYDKEKLQERIAKLSGGIAVISVGANTEAELKEKKLRVEDAVNATKAAVEEGIVAGGGVTLLRIRKAIEKLKLEGEEKIGAQILMQALEKPLRMIVENAGEDSGKILSNIERLHEEKKNYNIGYNVMIMDYKDMIEEGILDPAKVTRSALQNAVSVAVTILTTECLITDAPKPETVSTNSGMNDMGMM